MNSQLPLLYNIKRSYCSYFKEYVMLICKQYVSSLNITHYLENRQIESYPVMSQQIKQVKGGYGMLQSHNMTSS